MVFGGIGFKLRRRYPEPLTRSVIRRTAAIRLETSNCELLQIEPLELQFPFELKKQISCSMQLMNKSENHVAFKVKTTNPKKYCVRPNTGVMMPYSSCDVLVTMQAQKEAPPDMQCRDKFLLQSVVVNPGISSKDITPEMFNKESGNHVDECKLRVAYVPPPQPLHRCEDGSEEGSSPRASVSENGTVNQMPESLTQSIIWRTAAIHLEMSNCELLQIEPLELQFPFELKKQISCSMQLSNKSENRVAFKVKTTNPKKYCVRPNTGVMMPYSSCDVSVTMQAQKEAPPDMQCRDKFLLQSVVVSPGISSKDITPEMFNKESGNHVDECKLRVAYVPPPQPLHRCEDGSEEGSSPRASVSENGTVNQMPESLTQSIIWRTAAIHLEMSNCELLQIEPLELQFPFELKKQISCSMQLSNKSENRVAFKVKTTNPKKYCVRPNTGVMMPYSSCDVSVTMQAQKEAPPDMQCRDKFLLQSVVVNPGISSKDITPEMFNKDSGNQVDECKLRVAYVPPPQPLHRCEDGSEEGSSPRALVSENGTVNQACNLNVMSKEFPETNEVTFKGYIRKVILYCLGKPKID